MARTPDWSTIWALVLLCGGLAPAPLHAEPALRVQLLTVARQERVQDYSLSGTIEAVATYPAAFRDGGRLVAVLVDQGDRVRPGQEIAHLDPTQTEAAYRGATASLRGAEAMLLQATQAHDRAIGLLNKGTITRAEVDAAVQALVAATAARDQAAAQVAKADSARKDTVLRATEAAIITDRQAEPGQVVGAGQPVVTLAADAGREAVFYVPDSADLDGVLGLPVDIQLIDQPDRVLHGAVSEVSPLVDAATSTIRVRVRLEPAAGDDPLLGVPVTGHLTLHLSPAILVPWQALTATASGPAVWTVDPVTHRAGLTAVTVGDYDDDAVTITGGLQPGALVVGAGSQLLYPGRVIAPAPAADTEGAP